MYRSGGLAPEAWERISARSFWAGAWQQALEAPGGYISWLAGEVAERRPNSVSWVVSVIHVAFNLHGMKLKQGF